MIMRQKNMTIFKNNKFPWDISRVLKYLFAGIDLFSMKNVLCTGK